MTMMHEIKPIKQKVKRIRLYKKKSVIKSKVIEILESIKYNIENDKNIILDNTYEEMFSYLEKTYDLMDEDVRKW